ncbi:hypothetical protein OE88DRAFT_1811188 [Heliocybe sulcata]|uniref:ferric-chelate reductase (NADPH) n=1 Tax=Heliocybe sulcata TaxID=5364 RepID=A0A5C3N0W6_9AGAM|nr:hypothetical protein OE88DRAFT_1811188 [Heliocybe sulcata]
MAEVDNGALVFHIDIFILAAIGLFALLALPRIIGRLQGFRDGFVFRSSWQENALPRPSYDSEATRVAPVQEKQVQGAASPPAHVPEWTTYAHGLSIILRYPIAPRLSLGQVLLMVGYFTLLLYAELYRASAFKHPIRAGFVAMSQIPLVYALATKNNAIGLVVGKSYEKLNFLHQWTGTLLVLAANVHAIGYVYKWVYAGIWTKQAEMAYILWGIVALVCLDILFFFSTSIWRLRAYNIFYVSHVIAFIVFLVAVPLHQKDTTPYVAIAAGLLGLTKLEIPHINAGWRAGQHVRIRVLSRQMGWFGWTEMHPYTIASASHGPEGLVVFAKKSGRWSRNLYRIADGSTGEMEGFKGGRLVRVMLEGPYGGTGHCVPASFAGALLVGGGSGITFPLSVVDDLLRRGAEGSSRIQVLHLVWVVADSACLKPFISHFTTLLNCSTLKSFHVSVHYTGIRANIPEPPSSGELPDGLSLVPGRPNFVDILDHVVNETIQAQAEGNTTRTGVLVGVCGPVGLGQSVARVVGKVDPKRRKEVGGVELHEEAFGW